MAKLIGKINKIVRAAKFTHFSLDQKEGRIFLCFTIGDIYNVEKGWNAPLFHNISPQRCKLCSSSPTEHSKKPLSHFLTKTSHDCDKKF